MRSEDELAGAGRAVTPTAPAFGGLALAKYLAATLAAIASGPSRPYIAQSAASAALRLNLVDPTAVTIARSAGTGRRLICAIHQARQRS